MKILSIVLVAICLTISCPLLADPSRPLVFIPGILGSKLYLGDDIIWGDRGSYRRFGRLQLFAGDGIEAKGLVDKIRVLGPFRIKKYSTLTKYLTDGLGYELDKNLFLFAYDWRKSNFTSAQSLQAFIDQTPDLQIGSFDILAHSMGGLVGRIFIEKQEAGKRVASFITMGTPYRGSLNVMQSYVEGFSGIARFLSGNQDKVRSVFFSFESGYELLPDPDWDVCCYSGDNWGSRQSIDIYDIEYWKNWWVTPEFNTPTGLSIIQNGLNKRSELMAIVKKPLDANKQYHAAIATSLLDTKGKVLFDETGSITHWEYFPGDGTVDIESATLNAPFLSRVSLSKHAKIFDDDSARDVLRRILITNEEIYNFAGAAACTGKPELDCVTVMGVEASSVQLSVEPNLGIIGDTVTIEVSFRVETGQLPGDYRPTVSIEPETGPGVELELNPVSTTGISRYSGSVQLWSESEYVVKLVNPEYEGLEEYVILLAEVGNDPSD